MQLRNLRLLGPALLAFLQLNATPGAEAEQKGRGIVPAKLDITSSAFSNGQSIPKQYTGDGKNLSPPLSWSAPPAGTKSLGLICDDPDAPSGTWVHWVVYGISPKSGLLGAGVPAQACIASLCHQGINSFHKIGYGGPSPPAGKAHRYFFKLYALDYEPAFNTPVSAAELQESMAGHVLAVGELFGRYRR